jgi:hypothetical protein
MECLNIDFVGPYPDDGYVLVMADTFTRWVELYWVATADAEQTSLCLLLHFGRFGRVCKRVCNLGGGNNRLAFANLSLESCSSARHVILLLIACHAFALTS